MNNPVNIIQIREALKDSERYLAHNIDINRTDLLVDAVKRPLVHELHTDADVGVGDEGAIKGDDVV